MTDELHLSFWRAYFLNFHIARSRNFSFSDTRTKIEHKAKWHCSLAIEILLHVYIDDVAHLIEMLDKIFPAHIKKQLQSCAEKLKGHTEVIDSGETAIDPNRKVFDGLVPYKAFLYKVWG